MKGRREGGMEGGREETIKVTSLPSFIQGWMEGGK